MPKILIDEENILTLYQQPDLKKRRDVLRDTVHKLATARLSYYKKQQKIL